MYLQTMASIILPTTARYNTSLSADTQACRLALRYGNRTENCCTIHKKSLKHRARRALDSVQDVVRFLAEVGITQTWYYDCPALVQCRLSDASYFTFEPHIRRKAGVWGFKHENIYFLTMRAVLTSCNGSLNAVAMWQPA